LGCVFLLGGWEADGGYLHVGVDGWGLDGTGDRAMICLEILKNFDCLERHCQCLPQLLAKTWTCYNEMGRGRESTIGDGFDEADGFRRRLVFWLFFVVFGLFAGSYHQPDRKGETSGRVGILWTAGFWHWVMNEWLEGTVDEEWVTSGERSSWKSDQVGKSEVEGVKKWKEWSWKVERLKEWKSDQVEKSDEVERRVGDEGTQVVEYKCPAKTLLIRRANCGQMFIGCAWTQTWVERKKVVNVRVVCRTF
jgi:hypothetical protein